MPFRFRLLKRGALSQTFLWNLRIAVNFFVLIAEVSARSEGIQSFMQQSERYGEFEMGRKGCGWNESLVRADLCDAQHARSLFENAQPYRPRKTCPSLFRFVVKYRSVVADAWISRGNYKRRCLS